MRTRKDQFIRYGLKLSKTLGMNKRDGFLRTADTWYRRGVRDPRFEGLLMERLRGVYRAAAQNPERILFPGPRYDLSGQVYLGKSPSGGKIRIPLSALNAHTLIVGNSGAGKTVLLSLLICQLAKLLKGFLVTDMFKREFRHLLTIPSLANSIEVVRWNQLRINPLEPPPGIPPIEWASTIATALCQALQLPFMSANLLQEAILHLYEQFGVLGGGQKYPIMSELDPALDEVPAAASSKNATRNRLRLLLRTMGDNLIYRKGWKTSDLTRRKIILEMDGLAVTFQTFVCFTLIAQIFADRLVNQRSQRNLYGLVLDEGHRFYARPARSQSSGLSYISETTSLVRGMGLGLFVAVQYLHEIDTSIKANSATKILGRVGTYEDIRSFSHAVGMRDPKQWGFCQKYLEPGLFAGHLGYGSYRDVFLMEVPHVRPPRRISDREAIGSSRSLLELPVEEAVETIDVATPLPADEASDGPGGAETGQDEVAISQLALSLLRLILAHSGRPSTFYYRGAGLSMRKGIQAKDELVGGGWIEEERRGNTLILTPTTEADQLGRKDA